MKRILKAEGFDIPYNLMRKRVKNINIRIREGEVLVSAPERVPLREVEKILASRAGWLADTLGRQAARPRSIFSPGGKVYIHGQAVPLHYMPGRSAASLADAGLNVSAPSEEGIRPAVRAFLEMEAKNLLPHRVEQLYPIAAAAGVAFPRVNLRWMTGRWGSCACRGGSITLNKALVAAPPLCVDYVILHELCHFLHPNHSAAFYGTLSGWMPDYAEAQALLRGVAPADWTP